MLFTRCYSNCGKVINEGRPRPTELFYIGKVDDYSGLSRPRPTSLKIKSDQISFHDFMQLRKEVVKNSLHIEER